MTTLHVDLGSEWRGGQSQALLLMVELLRHGHSAELIAIGGAPLAERARKAGIRVHTVPALAARWFAAVSLAGRRADVIHCHDAHGLTSAWLGTMFTRRVLVASRRVAYRLPVKGLGHSRYQRAKRILAVSEFVKRSVVASGFPGDSVDVVYDGVELPDLAVSPCEKGGCVLGCVGYLLPEKNHELLIRSLPTVLQQHPACRLVVVGDGPRRASLEALATQIGVADAVRFAGRVEDIAEVYRSLDIFLFPSIAEPLGSSLLSAMAYSLPVVALSTGAMPEVVQHGKNGLLVPRPEPTAFAQAILSLLGDPDLGRRLGAAARSTIEDRFSTELLMRNTLRVYQEVCASGR